MILAVALAVVVARIAALEPRHVEPKILLPKRWAPDTRITNGEVATLGQFPYQVGLTLRHPDGRDAWWCGGILISDRFVLTAAHCVDGMIAIDVLLGATNRTDPTEPLQQTIAVGRRGIIVHAYWNPSTRDNNIALLKFPYPIRFNDNVQPIKLPPNNTFLTYENELSIASGWGKDSDQATSVSPVLRYIEVPIMPNIVCNRYYWGTIKAWHICIRTGSTHKSTCNGDSGGPLVVMVDGVPILVGATSFGLATGCEIGWPGVFTRVSAYLDWINAKTGIVIEQ